ncbi:MAG: fibronectin type III domain-containing protein [Smithella sp.]|nr:fibronectin type III domain-containing protein [Smithella sp.]
MKNKSKILSLLLVVVIVIGLMPISAFALDAPSKPYWDGNTIKWNAVEGADKYRVMVKGSEEASTQDYNMSMVKNVDIPASSTQMDLSEHLLPGMTYVVNVYALQGELLLKDLVILIYIRFPDRCQP